MPETVLSETVQEVVPLKTTSTAIPTIPFLTELSRIDVLEFLPHPIAHLHTAVLSETVQDAVLADVSLSSVVIQTVARQIIPTAVVSAEEDKKNQLESCLIYLGTGCFHLFGAPRIFYSSFNSLTSALCIGRISFIGLLK